MHVFNPHLRICVLILEREEGRGERERETMIGFLLHMPQQGIEPITSVCALTGGGTRNLFGVQYDAPIN